MATNKIVVSQCDNEIILIASTPAGSSTLCHLKSGYNAPVSYEFNPRHILPSTGTYTLKMVGINWGGPGAFEVTVITDGRAETFGTKSDDPFWFDQTTIEI